MRVGQARKRDYNEPEIVEALEAHGILVQKLNDAGVADLLCCRNGTLRLIEVKGPRGRATMAQNQRTMLGWPVYIARNAAEALAWFGIEFHPSLNSGARAQAGSR